jgi:hypothetical protein
MQVCFDQEEHRLHATRETNSFFEYEEFMYLDSHRRTTSQLVTATGLFGCCSPYQTDYFIMCRLPYPKEKSVNSNRICFLNR